MMNIINNRYRIIRNLAQTRLISSYLVSDGMNNHEMLQLNIINSEIISNKTIDFFIEEFINLTNIDNENIAKVFDFELIYSTDNIKLTNNEYFYTNTYVEDRMKFSDFLIAVNENDILGIFLQICKAVNYLHLKGFIYGELNTQNIIINPVDKKYILILKDLATIELEK